MAVIGRRGPAVATLLAAISIAACTEPEPGELIGNPNNAGPDFDCKLGFDALLQSILARPAVKDWGMDRDTARYIQDDARSSFYIVTGERHPAHPAIIQRRSGMSSSGATLTTEACAFGDREALDADIQAYDLMDRALMKEFVIYHYPTDEPGSPTLAHLTPPPSAPPLS